MHQTRSDPESTKFVPSGAVNFPDGEVLVRAQGVGKKFCRNLKKSLWYGLKDVAAEMNPISGMQKHSSKSVTRLRSGEFWANQGISFELRRGECLGLIGHNGAGKTTLLKMLNGLIKPDEGFIEMRGQIGALIALGAGFNPILSGRENIFVNGSVLGLSKQKIRKKFDEIVEFAEVEDFIDAPVQSYSSGMKVRLGFAVATALNPDILILDEVLAVGDASFRAKCYNRILSLRKEAAVIFVSHQMEQVGRICDRTLVLNKGRTHLIGDVEQGIQEYECLNDSGSNQQGSFRDLKPPILEFGVEKMPGEVVSGGSAEFELRIKSSEELSDFKIRINFFGSTGAISAQLNANSTDLGHVLPRGESVFRIRITSIPLRAGCYPLGFHLTDSTGDFVVWSHKEHSLDVTGGKLSSRIECQLSIAEWTIGQAARC